MARVDPPAHPRAAVSHRRRRRRWRAPVVRSGVPQERLRFDLVFPPPPPPTRLRRRSIVLSRVACAVGAATADYTGGRDSCHREADRPAIGDVIDSTGTSSASDVIGFPGLAARYSVRDATRGENTGPTGRPVN